MAMSLLKLTVEEKNYWKFCMLNVRVVPDALRKYFDSRIPPASLATTINQNSTTILNLVNRRVINLVQLDILQRIPCTIWPPRCPTVPTGSNATSSADFDVTLMVCLLRNIPLPGIYQPASGWDNLPIPSDTSPGAYLSRIKYYRNEIAHSTENRLNTWDFQGKWKTISEAISFCHGGYSPKTIMEILHCDFDGSLNGVIVTCLKTEIEAIKRDLKLVEGEKGKLIDELKRTELQLETVESDFHFYKDGHLPKNIADNIHELIKKWRIDDKPFFFTRAGKLVYDMLESENIVVIIGQAGSGKSATARNVALRWITYGYDVVPVESVEQILEYRCKETKQIFVIDDAVGKYSTNESYVNQWERLDSKLTTVFIDNNAKLICTLRKVVAIDTKFKAAKTCLSDKACIIDVDHEDNCLLPEEKMSILKNHLICTERQNEISDEECKECCNGQFAFPLLCHVFTTNDGLFLRKSDFFQKPFSYLSDEITKLYQQNKEVYCSLVICMLFSGKLKVKLFSVSDDSDEEQEQSGRIIGMIAEACGLCRNISRQTLLDSLLSVEGVYVELFGGIINFVHDTFLEAISFHFSKVNPCVFLECCDIAFLKERVRVISPLIDDDENVIVLKEESFYYLAIRYIAELKKGEFMDVLCSQPIKKEKFIKVMSDVIECGSLITRQKLIETKISCIAYFKWKHFDPVYQHKSNMEAVAAILEIFPHHKTLLHWVIATGCNYLMDYFFKQMSNKQQNTYIRSDKSLFSLALLSGCKEIIKTVIDRGADVNSLESQYALKRLVINGRDSQFFEFLMNNGIKMNFVDSERKSLLFYAITSKNLTIQTFLVEKDSSQHALHEAIYHSNIENLKALLSNHSINLVSNNGWSLFHFAAYKNDIAIMEIILETAMRNKLFAINKRDKIGWSPLHLASVLSNYEAVNFLMSKGAKVSLVDRDGKTPVHLSCNERITSSLLKYSSRPAEETTRPEGHSIEGGYTDNKPKDITKDKARSFKIVFTEADKAWIYTNEIIIANSFDFKQYDEQKWTAHANYHPVHQDVVIEIPESTKNCHLPSKRLIYAILMNILYLLSSNVKCRKEFDTPDQEGNTNLHAAASMPNEDDSIASLKILLERGDNPLFYNNDGCLPSDVAFYSRSYKVKRFLYNYLMHSAEREMRILAFISILTLLVVVSLYPLAHFVCPGYRNGDANNISNDFSVSFLSNYSKNPLHSDNYIHSDENNISLKSGNSTVNNQHMDIHPFSFIRPFSIFCVLFFNIFCALCKKLLWQTHFHSEGLYYMYVHLTALLKLTSICFSNLAKSKILTTLIFEFVMMNLLIFLIDTYLRLKRRYYPECLAFSRFTSQFSLCFMNTFLIVIFQEPFSEIQSRLPRIGVMLESLSSWSIVLLLFSFISIFIALYIYINIIPCIAYVILLKIWGKLKGFRQSSYFLQFGIFTVAFQSPLRVRPCFGNPSITWKNVFQAILIFILLFFETIVSYDNYHID